MMILKKLSATLIILFFSCALYGMENHIITEITPLTGMDHVKVILTEGNEWNGQDKLNVIIRSRDSSSVLWQGSVAPKEFEEHGKKYAAFEINGLKPQLWTPVNPFMYEIVISTGGNERIASERVGFRSFESRNGQLYLNNNPVFLRGIAINPPGRGIPDELNKSRKFAEDYVRFMKSIHVNIIRLQTNDELWFDVCDELGMMIFGGNYGGSVDVKGDDEKAQAPDPGHYDESVAWLKEKKLGPIAHHPCLMVYAITNETPFKGAAATKWEKFLAYASDKLMQWDNTRCYIANAGYGYGKSGDICDIHRYWGWYYASPFTFLNVRYNDSIIPFKKKVQPITFSECVGNYTGPDGRYNLSPNHKNPGSQLNWTGHAPDALQPVLANEHQSFTFKQATELFRRLRVTNRELSGIFPFTIMFYNWHTISSFVDMGPKPVTAQARLSYSPVLLSWECWTPNVYAGNAVQTTVHIVNDNDDFSDLENARLVYQLTDASSAVVVTDTIALEKIKYYATWEKKLQINIPAYLHEGNYDLKGEVIVGKKAISSNFYKLFIVNKGAVNAARGKFYLYDPSGQTGSALSRLNISFTKISSFTALPANTSVLIGENAADDKLISQAAQIKQFIHSGGHVTIMKQDQHHLASINRILDHPVKVVTMELEDPSYPPPARPSADGYYVNAERPDHPLFAGIDRENLKVWSDYTGWNETMPGFPMIHPVSNGFALGDKSDIGNVAVLADYGPGLEGIAIGEFFEGKGTVLLNGFDLSARAGIDPMADRLLLNMLAYMNGKQSHNLHPLIDAPIVWGDYASEKGILTGVNSGLIVNGKPRLTGSYSKIPLVITEEGDEFAGKPGGWNDRPGIQYVAFGRRPFGPYDLRGLGVPRPLDVKTTTIGTGSFWCSVPAGTASVKTMVWNPADTPLTIKIKVNASKEITKEIKPGETTDVIAPVDATVIHMAFTGDRRLVLLQTTFLF